MDFAGRVVAARGGCGEALGELLEACRKYMLLLANDALDSDLRPKTAASDLVQDTFVEAQKDFGRFDGSTEAELLAWLGKILANRIANNRRRFRGTRKRDVRREISLDSDRRSPPCDPADGVGTPSDQAIAREDDRRLTEAMLRLPEPLRQVLVLRTWEQATFAEIGGRLNMTAEAARKTWGRAVRRLQRELYDIP